MIPTTIAGILVLVLAVLPGIPGDRVYRALVGVSVRESDLEYVLRLVTFSVLGLAAYATVAARVHLPPPGYIIPSNFAGQAFQVGMLPLFGAAYLGHFAASAGIGALTAAIQRFALSRIQTVSSERDAWDHFVNHCLPQRWAALRLQNGETYVGMVDHADITADPDHRDIILEEPARLDPTTREYVSLTHQHLFLRGSEVVSVCTLRDPADQRITEPGTILFQGGNLEGCEASEAQSLNSVEGARKDGEKGIPARETDTAPRRSTAVSAPGEEQQEVGVRRHGDGDQSPSGGGQTSA